jgi:colicin import membrane protein
MTQKEQLDDLQKQLTAAQQETADIKAKLDAEIEAHAATQAKQTAIEEQLAAAEAKHKAEIKAHAATQAQLDAEEQKDKTADAKAAEQLAAKGIAPAQKDAPANLNASQEEGAALWERYAKADPISQAQMRATHGEKLTAAAVAYDAAQKIA